MRILSYLATLAALSIPVSAMASSIELNTGTAAYHVEAPGNPGPFPLATTISNPNPGWGAVIPGAEWINASGSGSASDPAGEYIYYVQFTTTGAGTISGEFASDNNGTAFLSEVGVGVFPPLASNEYGTGGSTYSFNTVTPFSGSVDGAGVYYLEFDVMNGNGANDTTGPTGLLAAATFTSATPEPSSLLLLGTGIAGLAGAVRRKLRS